jgi:hypothetical protein
MFQTIGAEEMAKRLKLDVQKVYLRRRNLERKHGIVIKARRPRGVYKDFEEHPGRVSKTVVDGTILVGSDHHYWPGIISTAHRAFVHFCKKMKPVGIVANGDVLDGSSISRHPPIGWEHRPSLVSEIEASSDRLDEMKRASPNSWTAWTLGNHDARFSSRLAAVAPEFAKVRGIQLKDHYPGWQPCWSIWVNDDVVIKHRQKNGIHATHNNTMWAGKTMVTGHLHSLKVTPLTDYNGTRFGVDTGTMADTYGPQFEGYMEDNSRNWRSGFVVLTFRNSVLMWPEVVAVVDEDHVQFRGELIKV